MSSATRLRFGVIAGILASLFCFSGGIFLLNKTDGGMDTMSVGLGLYFVGKGFFVGPMLILAALPRQRDDKAAEPSAAAGRGT